MIRFYLALLVGKLILWLINFLALSGGKAAPGYYALKIDPDLVKHLAKSIPVSIMVTGTNGKTTTCRIIHHFLKSDYKRILRNSTGSNLERGVASELLKSANWSGHVETDIALWEVDEAAFNHLLLKLQPDYLVIMNALRDQLDRYGEVDTIVEKWCVTLEKASKKPLVIYNGSDPNLDKLLKIPNTNFIPFIFSDHNLKWEGKKSEKPKIGYTAKITEKRGLDGNQVTVSFGNQSWHFDLNLPGEYQVYNLAAAVAVINKLGIKLSTDKLNTLQIQSAFGRMEKVVINGCETVISLIKNPAGATTVLETLVKELKSTDQVVILLNDGFADGQDISWIWDTDFEILSSLKKVHYWCGGTRGADMTLRLKYAGIESAYIHTMTDKEILPKISGKRLFVLPTYTALLSLQNDLAKLGIKNKNWQEE